MISPDRQGHFAHIVIDGLYNDDVVDYSDEDLAMRSGKLAVNEFAKELEQIDIKARKMVSSLKRNVPEGSPEWDIMYNKYFEEELKRRNG